MKENVADRILARINKRVEGVAERLATSYRGVKPFDSQEVKPEDQLYWYDQLTPDDMDYLIGKHGNASLNEYIFLMEQLKGRTK